MNYWLFFCNYFIGGSSFVLLCTGDFLGGAIFTICYLFTYWLATRKETEETK